MQQQAPKWDRLSNTINKAERLSYAQRAQLCTNEIAQTLFALMERKQTNLIVSADVTTKKELLSLIDAVGPYVCAIKTHIDIVVDFDTDLIEQLQALSKQYNFLIFEDRKFADIGNTVRLQYQKGIYRIADWAHITNAYTVPGPGIIEGLRFVGLPKKRGLILLSQMSSKGNLATDEYTQQTIALADTYDDFVIGFIAREKLTNNPKYIHFTPGVKLQAGTDNLGQQYLTPQRAIANGSDCIIVGRGIYHADNPVHAAQEYKTICWQAYLDKIS